MKKILRSILFLGIMTLGVLGCEKPKRNFEIGDKSDINILQNDVTMTIKEKNLKKKYADVLDDKGFLDDMKKEYPDEKYMKKIDSIWSEV